MSSAERGQQRPLVLVVDDDEASAGLAADALEPAVAVRTARTLAEALDRLRDDRPSAVVLDLGLPDAVGVEGVRALAGGAGVDGPDVPVVVLTGNRDEDLVERALLAGADDYVRKDDLAQQLPSAVRYALGRARRRQLLRSTVRDAGAVLAALAGPAVVRDADGCVAAANEAAVALLGLRQDDAGRWLEPQLRWTDEQGSRVAADALPSGRALRSGRSEQGRVLALPGGERTRWLEVDAHPLAHADGEVYAVVESLRDITARREAEERTAFQAHLLDAVGQSVIATDAAGLVTYWNRAAERLYGWPVEEALGRPIVDLTPARTTRAQAEEILLALRAGLPWSGDFQVQRRDGTVFTALVANQPLLADDGSVVGVIGVSTDITERVEAELASRRLSAVVDSTGDPVLLLSVDGVVTAWNRAAEQLYGWTAEEAVGRDVAIVVPPEVQPQLREVLARALAGETVRGVDTVRRCKGGSTVEVQLTVSPVLDRDGAVVAVSSIDRDVTERQAWQRRLEHAALHDDLTGLPNRTLLQDRLDQAIGATAREDAALSVLFVDLDDFKDVNDAEGHLLGDLVLREVGARLGGVVRPGDTVARFGGDEFVVVLPGSGMAEARDVAERLLAALREPMHLEGRRLHVSASIGLAVSPPVEPMSLLRAADAAVYDAKARGRGQVGCFVGALSQHAEERLQLSGELRDALLEDALHLVYQPVVDLGTGAVLGVEALLRWHHPRRGDVAPSVFVPVAEKTGLARELDTWVLRRATAEFAALCAAGEVPREAYLAVNVTVADVVDPAFPGTVAAALDAAGLPPGRLVVEVTETGVMNDLDTGVRMLTRLRDLGVRIAIDDFGTGWSSLTYVKRLPASILKLDRSFVSRLHEDDDDLAIAASVIELGRATGMTVVAEGVETGEQLAALRQLGCRAAQGYLWHRGVRADALPQALAAVRAVVRGPDPPRGEQRRPRRALDLGPEHGLERLWELHGEGASLATIAAALNRDGYRLPTGQRWHSRTVARALGEPALAQALEHEDLTLR